jgi:hypothetical protein
MSKITFTIPDYLSLGNYKKLTQLDHLSDLEKTVASLTILTDLPEEKIREMQSKDLARIHSDVIERTMDVISEFYPVFEMDGVTYGFADISSMTLGEYVDLDRLVKEPVMNLSEIMAILYRPILKHRFNSFQYAFKQSFKVKLGEAENIFKYYTLEKYDNKIREERAVIMDQIPASFALGALSFFLQIGSALLIGSMTSFPEDKKQKKAVMKETKEVIKKTLSDNIGGGLQLFITSRQLPSLQSQEIKLSQI